MKEFIYIPFPRIEESPSSLLKRLAVHHGCVNQIQFKRLGAPSSKSKCLSAQYGLSQWIAAKSGQHTPKFLSGFYQPVGITGERMPHKIDNLVVSFNLIRWRRTAFCSECWAEEYEHFMKDLKISVNCPYHNRRYLTHCPGCSVGLQWINPLTDACNKCKTKLTSPACPPEDAAPERYILSLFRERKQEQLDQLFKNLQALQFNRDHPQTPESRLALETAINLVDENVAGVKRFLEIIREKHPHIPNEAICAKLSLLQSPTVKKACEAFCLEVDLVTPKPPPESKGDLLTSNLNNSFSLTHTQVRRSVHMGRKVLKKIIAETSHIVKSLGERGVFNEVQVLAFFAKLKEIKSSGGALPFEDHSVDFPTAAAALGVSLQCLKKLFAAGLIRIMPLKSRMYRISGEQLQEFSNSYETLNSLAARSHRQKNKIVYLMRTIGIHPINIPGISAPTLLHKKDSDLLLNIIQRNTPPNRKNSVAKTASQSKNAINKQLYHSLSKASKLYKIDRPALRALIHAGILHPIKHPCLGGNTIGLLKTELEDIKKNYITLTTATEIIGIATRAIRAILGDIGLHPVIGGPQSRCNTWLCARQAVENFVNQQKSKTGKNLTIQQTSKKLHIRTMTAYELIKSGDLAAQCDTHPSQIFADADKVNAFSKTHANIVTVAKWCGLPCRGLKNLLSGMGVPAVGDTKHTGNTIFYRIIDLEKAGILCRPEATCYELAAYNKAQIARKNNTHENLSTLERMTPTSAICKKFDISQKLFTTTFTKTKFISTITIGNNSYLTPENMEKLSAFLSQYILLSTADKIIGRSRMIFRLLKRGDITQATQLPSELAEKKFLIRYDFDKLLNQLKSS